MATEITEQIVREAPEIQAYKVGLLESAKRQAEAKVDLPAYQVAGFSQPQIDAISAGLEGIGAYQPYLASGTEALGFGMGTTAEAADVLRGADTRGQFEAAQQAYNLAAEPAASIGSLANVAGAGMGLIGQGAEDITRAQDISTLGIGALAGAGQGFQPSMTQEFMNPYQQAVIDESMRQIQRQGDIARQNLQAQAVRAGAFGGSREGIQRAELDRALAEQKNAAIVGALQSGYGQAQQMAQQSFEQQQQRQLAQAQGLQQAAQLYGSLGSQRAGLSGMYGSLAGQQAGILGQQSQLQQALGQGIGNLAAQQFGVGQQMASTLGGLGSQLGNLGVQQAALGQTAQQLGQSDVGFMFDLGRQQQAQQQAALDAQRATSMQQAMQPYQQLAFLSDIYKGAPSSQMATTAASQPTPSPFQQLTGLATGTIGALGAAKSAKIL